MKKVIIKFAMFSIPQKVYIEDENGKISKYIMPLDKIPSFIASLDCCDVYTYGVKPFCAKLEKDVCTNFNKNNICWHYNDKDKINDIVHKAGLDQ